MTQEQFDRLPDCFQRLIKIDRAIRHAPVVPYTILRERREQVRLAQILLQPANS